MTKLVVQSLNATDEYINNITSTVQNAKEVISQDVETVNAMADSQNSLLAVQFAGMFTVLVILVSGYHLSQHLRHMYSPVVQRKIMAVLWMTPIYSITSWLSLCFPLAEPYLAVIREFYESYCVYTFLSFLISVLGRGDRFAVLDLLEANADQLSPPDKCRCGPKFWKRCWAGCCNGERKDRVPNDLHLNESNVVGGIPSAVSPPWGSGNDAINSPNSTTSADALHSEQYPSNNRLKAEAVLDQCQTYAMQFVLLRPLTAIGWLVSNQLVEPKSFLDWTSPQIYIVIVTNLSIFFAFRGLVKFYHATRTYLAWCNPWPKFLCIKGVVFMTFWQKMTISIIVHVAYADKFKSNEEATDFVARSQNFLICLEMLFAAVAHCFVFSPDEWAEGYREREERRRKRQSELETHFGDSVALGDFIRDVKTVMASKRRRRQRKKMKHGAVGGELSPNSATSKDSVEDDEDGTLEMSESADGDEQRQRGSVDDSDHFDQDFTISDDNEYEMELASSPSPVRSRRLNTGSSDEGEFVGSWARIENFIQEHDLKEEDGNEDEESASSNDHTKEIV